MERLKLISEEVMLWHLLESANTDSMSPMASAEPLWGMLMCDAQMVPAQLARCHRHCYFGLSPHSCVRIRNRNRNPQTRDLMELESSSNPKSNESSSWLFDFERARPRHIIMSFHGFEPFAAEMTPFKPMRGICKCKSIFKKAPWCGKPDD